MMEVGTEWNPLKMCQNAEGLLANGTYGIIPN